MYNTVMTISVVTLSMAGMLLYLGLVQTAVDWLVEQSERRERRAELRRLVTHLEAEARKYDPVFQAADRGQAVGELVMYRHELDLLEGRCEEE